MAARTGEALIAQMDELTVPTGELAIWGLGQMGFALKGAGPEIIYIDPCLSDVVRLRVPALAPMFARAYPPPLEPGQIHNAAYVLCSHEHLDHTDPLTLGPLAAASPQAHFVISGWAHAVLDEAQVAAERRIVPAVGQPIALGPLRLTALPSAHYDLEADERGQRWLGFHLQLNGVTLYHSGDTLIYPGLIANLRALPPADLAILAVNGRDAYRDSFDTFGNLLPAEAAWLAAELGWGALIGGHNDLYAWNTIAAGALADACARLCPRLPLHTLQPGELLRFVP
jgi:L-ascorbate metabolism protein UlaG (beta-lactamase superfamily)